MKNHMEYKEYSEKIKNFIKKSTPLQRLVAGLFGLVVLAVGIYLINPPKRLLEMRNSQRRADVASILNSVYQYSIDHNGALPAVVTSQPTMICKSKASSCDGLVDISEIVADKKYQLSSVPVDPREKDTNSSGYQLYKLSNGRLGVSAPLAENKAVISLSK